MKRSLLNEWIKRLEDPNTKQGKGRLRTLDNSFCCLGVLCNIIDPFGWKLGDNCYGSGNERYFASMPPKLAASLGMYELGENFDTSYEISLASMKDSGFTFKEIAQVLKEKPLVYIRAIEEDV